MKSIGKITRLANIVREYSALPNAEKLGEHRFTMELYTANGTLADGSGEIEWDIPALEETEHIGVWWNEARELTDYDGVFCLPNEAIDLLQSLGISVSQEFRTGQPQTKETP